MGFGRHPEPQDEEQFMRQNTSEQTWARLAGFALLAVIVVGLAGMVLQAVGGSGTDVQNILAKERRYRVGLACEFVMLNNDVLLAVALYGLLRRVDAPLALLGTLWRFANAVILGVGVVAALTALSLVHSPEDFGSFHADQMQNLATQFLYMHWTASPIGLTFWSMGAAVHSYLLWKSKYIPRALSAAYLGVAVAILFGCFACLISPGIQAMIDPWFVFPDLPVELAVGLWLLIKGARIHSEPITA
jgi:hypothetical protein